MILLRKIDHWMQVIWGLVMLVSIPFLFLYGFAAGLFILGFWQLLSAFLNTKKFMAAGLGEKICIYWKYTGLIFAFLFLCALLTEIVDADNVQVLACIAIAGSIPLACYYIVIYGKLIAQEAMRKELGGLIKS